LEISTIEEERHKVREKEHGKNYLLETYLKGIHGADSSGNKQCKEQQVDLTAGNSDSGVHTEETAASPEVQHEDEISDTLIPLNEQNLTHSNVSGGNVKKQRRSKREHELMLEHQSTKEYSSAISNKQKSDVDGVVDEVDERKNTDEMPINSEVAAQIDILEKLIVLNKHLQREEELCVRLSAKIKRYEADASGLSEAQVKESLKRVNEQLDAKNCEIAQMENEIKTSDEALTSKTDVLKKLYDDLEEAEVEHRKLDVNTNQNNNDDVDNDTIDWADTSNNIIDDSMSTSTNAALLIPPALPPLKSEQHKLLTANEDLNMSREYLAENIYNISKMILKNSGPAMPVNANNLNHLNSIDFACHTAADQKHQQLQFHQQQQPAMPMLNQQIYQMPPTTSSSLEKRVIQAQIHTIPTNVKFDQQQQQPSTSIKYNEAVRASMNYLATINQRIQKNNQHIDTDINNANNASIIQATQYKLGPKKLLINAQAINGSCSSNSNSIESRNSNIFKRNMILQQPNDCINLTTQQDVSQLGTLV
jgi:Ras association domain-containing protein 9/10